MSARPPTLADGAHDPIDELPPEPADDAERVAQLLAESPAVAGAPSRCARPIGQLDEDGDRVCIRCGRAPRSSAAATHDIDSRCAAAAHRL